MINPGIRVAVVACGAVITDQVSKYAVIHSTVADHSVRLVGFMQLQLVHNTGVAFSLFSGARWGLVLVGICVLVGVMIAARRSERQDRLTQGSLGLIAGGAIGNLIDRIRLGSVIDFIDVGAWPTFNVADICIVVGVGLLLLRTLTMRNDEEAA